VSESSQALPVRLELGGPALSTATPLYAAGEARCQPGPDGAVPERRYAGPAIGAVIRGVFDYRAQNGRGLAAPGSIVFANGGETFSCRHLDSAGNRRAVIALNPQTLKEVANDCGFEDPSFDVAVLPASRRATAFYGAIRKAAAGSLAEDGVIELMGEALRLAGGAAAAPIAPAERARVLAVAHRLDEAYGEPVTLSEMAGWANLSRYHFVRVFRAVVGDSPHQYLIGARLRAAADRLLDTREPVTEIALGVGFNDLSHFHATFRRAFGISPRAWRKAA
jgi:AraC family transcriptional regulator